VISPSIVKPGPHEYIIVKFNKCKFNGYNIMIHDSLKIGIQCEQMKVTAYHTKPIHRRVLIYI